METIFNNLLPFILSLAGGFIGFILKRHIDKLDEMDKRIDKAPTEAQIRLLFDDKLLPLKEDVQEIRYSVNNLVNRIINGSFATKE